MDMVSSLVPEEGAAALLLAAGTTPRRQRRKRPAPASAAAEVRGRARYDCAGFEEEPPVDGGFAPPRLVWAKVRGHPWWPGQVFDPADASGLALHERPNRRPDAVLVACFGDRTFVWADAEDLLPLREGFPRLAEIGGRSFCKSTFATAIEDALDEVSRRVDAGLSCRCGGAASVKRQFFVNSGLRRGARGADAVDAAFARDAFRDEAFVGYVRALAVAPTAGADRLDLAIAAAQLKAFALWRSAANPEHDATSGVDDVTYRAMMVAARAGRGRATTPRRERTGRRLFRGDAPAGDIGLSMCARAAAAADAAFMRHMFPDEALEEYASAMAVTPPAGSELRDLAVACTPQRKAFDQWRDASPRSITVYTGTMDDADAEEYASAMAVTPPAGAELRGLAVATTAQLKAFDQCTVTMDVAANGTMDECTGTLIVANCNAEMEAATPPPACRDTPAKKTRSSEGDDADADPGKCWTVTSCISSREDSACEKDGDDAWETESEEFEPASEWGLGWKDYVIILQFVAIVLLVCELMWQHPEKIEL